jgi:hypothetical protein
MHPLTMVAAPIAANATFRIAFSFEPWNEGVMAGAAERLRRADAIVRPIGAGPGDRFG